MPTSAKQGDRPLAINVQVEGDYLHVFLKDGRAISVPRSWYPRLAHASTDEANDWELLGNGECVSWSVLDEDIGVADLLDGFPSGESARSFGRWLQARQQGRGVTFREIEEYERSQEFHRAIV